MAQNIFGRFFMDNIILVRPTKDLENQVIEYKMEHFSHGETEINGSELLDKTENYDEWLEMVTKNISKDTVNQNWVVTDTFFAIREYDKKIVGIIDFRHELNDFLKDFGHIGYSVRPTERKKGYATEMLRLVLDIAKKTGLERVELSCKKNNIPSVKSIIKNNGVYERSFKYGDEIADVFYIKL
jgi:predicted acetyltransferase